MTADGDDLIEVAIGEVTSRATGGGVRHSVGFLRAGKPCGVSLRLTPRQAGAIMDARRAGWPWSMLNRAVITAWRRGTGRARLEFRWSGFSAGFGSDAGAAVAAAARAAAPLFVRREVFERSWSAGGLAAEARLRGVGVRAVLDAVAGVPRHEFVPEETRHRAYEDTALPIRENQTVSQPSLVARMTELIRPAASDRVLEIGTGSGYQAAILSRLVRRVYSVEIIPALAREAEERLAELGYGNVRVRNGDGGDGWPAEAPFDGIVVTCAAPRVPAALVGQLKEGGRMVVPVRGPHGHEDLMLVRKLPGGRTSAEKITDVWFVPMTGKDGIA